MRSTDNSENMVSLQEELVKPVQLKTEDVGCCGTSDCWSGQFGLGRKESFNTYDWLPVRQ